MTRLWILGASDPEMEAIEALLREAGEEVQYACGPDGRRVHPGGAYRATLPAVAPGTTIYLVECDGTRPEGAEVIVIDHHRPGDPGYGRQPEDFLPASSLGQVIAELARLGSLPPQARWHRWPLSAGEPGTWLLRGYRGLWSVAEAVADVRGHCREVYIPTEVLLAAAADHCLAAAYRGECPGVYPDQLMRWRAESRARFQGRSVEAVLDDIERAREALRAAPRLPLAILREDDWIRDELDAANADFEEQVTVADLRGQDVPELPEAAAREGRAFLATVRERDGRQKVVLQAATPDQVRVFVDCWAREEGLVDIYGDPARGFAGGYLPVEQA